MVLRDDLAACFSDLLQPEKFNDYCPNGLQVEGKSTIKKIISGVTACQALLDQAIIQQADAILVHHGYFWKGEAAAVVGMKQRRLKVLLQHDINLFAYHLPLDAHLEFGNNVQLAKLLNLKITATPDEWSRDFLFVGEAEVAVSAADFNKRLSHVLHREPQHIAASRSEIKKIAWCTGAAQDYIERAVAMGADAFISGEISERTVHVARELDIHYFAAGHHATERYGVQALGEHVATQFDLQHEFIDIPNPV